MCYSQSHAITLIALVAVISISPSLGQGGVENYLRALCSRTNDSVACWKVIGPQLIQFTDPDPRRVADTIIVLAKTKGEDIREELDRLIEGSRDERLQRRYGSCSKNYGDALRDLYFARRLIELNDVRAIPIEVDDSVEELSSCEGKFGNGSFDPAHVGGKNYEFGVHLQIVKVATENLF